MTATNHALTGAMIATAVKRPYLAIPLAFLSHFVCDAIPHFGFGVTFGSPAMFIYLICDGLAALSFAIFLLAKHVKSAVFLAITAFVAMSPDLAWLYYGLHGKTARSLGLDPISKFHHWIQWSEHPWGIIIEAAWALLMVTIILKLNHENYQNTAATKAA